MRKSTVENAILVDLLVHGDDKAENIGRRTDTPASSISRSLTQLANDGLIRNKGGGVYQLRERGEKMARSMIEGGYNPYNGEGDADGGADGGE